MIIIKLSVRSKKEEVTKLLEQLKSILNKDDFDIDRDITLIRTEKEKEKIKFSTPYTMLDMDYETEDVVERLKELTIQEYSETIVDRDDLNPPLLYIFGKNIDNRQIFIKFKIKGNASNHVLCVSFHYAERKMTFPYA